MCACLGGGSRSSHVGCGDGGSMPWPTPLFFLHDKHSQRILLASFHNVHLRLHSLYKNKLDQYTSLDNVKFSGADYHLETN